MPLRGAIAAALTPLRDGAVDDEAIGPYVNFLADEGPEQVESAYGARAYGTLAAVKRAYDPDNVFRTNHNIRPAR